MATINNSQNDGVLRVLKKDINDGDIIGLPPSYIYDAAGGRGHDYLVLSGMPIMSIQPALPKPATSPDEGSALQLFEMDFVEGWKRYNDILSTVYSGNRETNVYKGLKKLKTKDTGNILVAFQNDASISETFTAEYSESRFEGMGAALSNDIMSELRYITGTGGTGEAISEILPPGIGEEGAKGILGTAAGTAGNIAGWGTKQVGRLAEWATGGTGYTKLISGSRIDFPQIWRGSGYSPSYSVTIRLYNPYPKNINTHRRFIIEPLAKLIALIIPVSDSKSTFSYPLICAVSCPGLFCLDSAYISSLDIIKGGDTNAITYTQRPVMVDIKMTIGSLYNTMISHGYNETDNGSTEIAIGDRYRPTFRNYIQQLETEAEISDIEYTNIYDLIDITEEEIGLPSTAPTTGESTDIIDTLRVPTGLQNKYTNLLS